jgi:hypothetical protein
VDEQQGEQYRSVPDQTAAAGEELSLSETIDFSSFNQKLRDKFSSEFSNKFIFAFSAIIPSLINFGMFNAYVQKNGFESTIKYLIGCAKADMPIKNRFDFTEENIDFIYRAFKETFYHNLVTRPKLSRLCGPWKEVVDENHPSYQLTQKLLKKGDAERYAKVLDAAEIAALHEADIYSDIGSLHDPLLSAEIPPEFYPYVYQIMFSSYDEKFIEKAALERTIEIFESKSPKPQAELIVARRRLAVLEKQIEFRENKVFNQAFIDEGLFTIKKSEDPMADFEKFKFSKKICLYNLLIDILCKKDPTLHFKKFNPNDIQTFKEQI